MGRLLIFDISGGELLLVLLFILLFFGAKGIPDIARTMGKAMRQMRDASDSVQREIQRGATEVKRGIDQQVKPLKEAAAAMSPESAPEKAVEAAPPIPPPPSPPRSIPSGQVWRGSGL